MATLPFTPDDAKAIIPDPSSSLCGNFMRSLLKLPVLFYQLVNFLFDSSGNPTKDAVNTVLPTGSYLDSAATLTEDGRWLLCDGREVSQTTYADLYGVIGATYGVASSGNFKLPDFRAKFPVGIGNFATAGTISLGVAGGEDKHLLTQAEQGSIDVTIVEDDGDSQTGARVSIEKITINTAVMGDAGSLATQGPTNTKLKADAAAHANIPPYLGMYRYIIT
jgi:microcystin-dependent protein